MLDRISRALAAALTLWMAGPALAAPPAPIVPAYVPQGGITTLVIRMASTGACYGASSTATCWAGMLASTLSAQGINTVNTSVAGNSTADVIAGFNTQIAPYRPAYVMTGTSVQNEPLWGSDPISASRVYLENTRIILRMIRQIGAVPVLAIPFIRNGNSAAQYLVIKDLKAALEGLGVIMVDMMSGIDDGTGKIIGGTTYSGDGTHLNDAGQPFYYDAVDPAWFQKPLDTPTLADPTATGSWLVTSGNGVAISFDVPSGVKSFTMRARIKGGSNAAANVALMTAYLNGTAAAPLRLRDPSYNPALSDTTGTNQASSTINLQTDGAAHEYVMTYNAITALGALYIDGAIVGSPTAVTGTPGAATRFTFAGRNETGNTAPANGFTFSDILVARVPWTAEQVSDTYKTGRVPPGSLLFRSRLANTPRSFVPNAAPGNVMATTTATFSLLPGF